MTAVYMGNVLVMDADTKFLEALKYAIDRTTSLDKYNAPTLISNASPVNYKLIEERVKWDLLIIDSGFVNEELMRILNLVFCNNPKSKLILMVSNNEGYRIKETIRTIDSLDAIIDMEFILGGNISDSMKVEQCLSFIIQELK
jgi:hypothetical protein